MFDVGFWELALIGVVALLIIGPERLPGAAQTVGLWVGKGRRMLRDVKDDINRELREQNVADIAALQKDFQSAGDQLKQATEEISESAAVTADVEQAAASLKASFEEASPLNKSSGKDAPLKTAGKTGAAKKTVNKKTTTKTATKKTTAKKSVVKKQATKKKAAKKKISRLHTATPKPKSQK